MSGLPLTHFLPPLAGSRIAVIGCGGKTTTVGLLAAQNPALYTLISPTTKIRCPGAGQSPVCTTAQASAAHTPRPGVQYCGVLAPATEKLAALPPDVLAQIEAQYQLVLMEADGSRSLPCKGWLNTEPVIPPFTTLTLGVVTTAALGKPATEEYVLRLPLFCQLTGLAPGGLISLQALAAMVAAPGGMFKNAVGTQKLLINKVKTGQDLAAAQQLAACIRQNYPSFTHTILAGSALKNLWQAV